MTSLFVIACGVCYGMGNSDVLYVQMAMLSLPFLMVGGMFSIMYWKGAFKTRIPEGNQGETENHDTKEESL
ncbi:MAG: hypothetical protein ABEK50_15140 [bacterium]